MSGALQMADPNPFLLRDHLVRMIAFSGATFGPGPRSKGVVDHIRKELTEIEADPLDVKEWIDVVILGLDGAWRALATKLPEGEEVNAVNLANTIVHQLVAKQDKNESRVWPDWRLVGQDRAIEHDRSHDVPAPEPEPTPAPVVAKASKTRSA